MKLQFIFAAVAVANDLEKSVDYTLSERGVNQFCDYMEFTGNNLMMYPCQMTWGISKWTINAIVQFVLIDF